ncbi:MAG: hypothetical protein Q8M19_17150 [Reyranella sp.]|nr:hypothetical protein [Reyranella sp.]
MWTMATVAFGAAAACGLVARWPELAVIAAGFAMVCAGQAFW